MLDVLKVLSRGAKAIYICFYFFPSNRKAKAVPRGKNFAVSAGKVRDRSGR